MPSIFSTSSVFYKSSFYPDAVRMSRAFVALMLGALAWCVLAIPASALEPRKGFYGEGTIDMSYLFLQNASTSSSALPSGMGGEVGYVFGNAFKLGFLFDIHASPMSNKTKSFAISTPSIVNPNTRYAGAKLYLETGFGLKLGLNLAPKSHSKSIYINSGIQTGTMQMGATGDVSALTSNIIIPIEVEGIIYKSGGFYGADGLAGGLIGSLAGGYAGANSANGYGASGYGSGALSADKFGFYYLAGVDLMMMNYTFYALESSQGKSDFVTTYALKAGLGFSYKLNHRVRFFTRLIAKYTALPQSSTATITTNADSPSFNDAFLPSTSASVHFPKGSALSVLLKIGVGF